MISKIFKSRIPSCNYIYKDGTVAFFIQGSYSTPDQKKIDELMDEIRAIGCNASMHPQLYVDETDQEIDSEALTPFELLKQRAKEEAIAELKASGMMSDTKSESDTSSFAKSMVNSSGENAVESNGAPATAGLAKLAAMTKK